MEVYKVMHMNSFIQKIGITLYNIYLVAACGSMVSLKVVTF